MVFMSVKANGPIGLNSYNMRILLCVDWIADCDFQHLSDKLIEFANITQTPVWLVK